MRPWDGFVSIEEQDAYQAAGLGKALGIGNHPALLIIDVQYRTAGTRSMPYEQAVREFVTSCGEVAWNAVPEIARLLALFRTMDCPVLFPYVSIKTLSDRGRVSEKSPGLMTSSDKGYEFVAEVAPLEGDILLPKKHPSAFFGTPLVSYLINLGVDTLVVAGCSTSGCVRATVVDAFSYNFRVVVPEECVYDRSATSHAVNLFDMASKYADVAPLNDVMAMLRARPTGAIVRE
ncbi:MAG: isochorismatase family protein [Hyphomonas sp.]